MIYSISYTIINIVQKKIVFLESIVLFASNCPKRSICEFPAVSKQLMWTITSCGPLDFEAEMPLRLNDFFVADRMRPNDFKV